MGLNYTGAGLNLSHSLFGCKVCAFWFNIYTIDVGCVSIKHILTLKLAS